VLVLRSDAQKKAVLPRYCGEKFVPGSAAVCEQRWDFSPAKMQTTARRDGGAWLLEGKKCLVPLAEEAPFVVVYARDEKDQIGAFLVPAGTPGLQIGERARRTSACGRWRTYEITLADCRIPADARLGGDAAPLLRTQRRGAVGDGRRVARPRSTTRSTTRKTADAFGVKIAQKQAIAFMLADMAIEIDAMRLLNWEAAWNLDQGNASVREVALARQYAADGVMQVPTTASRCWGSRVHRDHPSRCLRERPWLRHVRRVGVGLRPRTR